MPFQEVSVTSAPTSVLLRDVSVIATPLVVDLDGTLIKSDLLLETFFDAAGQHPLQAIGAIGALGHGKAALKARLASISSFDPEFLPYDPAVISIIEEARQAGRPVYLASASNEQLVKSVADHLGLFDGWMGSDSERNLSGRRKADLLVEKFGAHGFDYIGNDKADLDVWQVAASAIAVRTSARTRHALDKMHSHAVHLPERTPTLKSWLRLLRVHQYVKNGLLLVPLMTAHLFQLTALVHALLGIVAFSLCASSVYLLNDLVDLRSDRSHTTKHLRPLACGAIPLGQAVALMPVLLATSMAIGWFVSPAFFAVLCGYYALTTAYSFVLKRKMLVDVVTLAALYSIRVIAGGVAIDVVLSEWLLGFSMFIFMSLALIKRYAELAVRLDLGLSDPTNRNYKIGDLQIVATMATVCGFNAVTVLALYISSPAVHVLYREPRVLWLMCPVIMYWTGRMMLMTHRRFVTEDPIIFAVRDRVSLLTLGTCFTILVAAYL
ncbi:UbiA family prenyltransferase [Lichenicola cladoniae]|uniref:UbiA family prenyltransferase n=2 Tax=Lichenicola cladoniae TaxID=1484109 RepID=A0A6M8HX12_9PROT|nr:UbiA family prenyltransferase [Acetobacteraceae bacterium]QKE92786.1 UbiA family prenyltransferase [Lichenicola cladoniae]